MTQARYCTHMSRQQDTGSSGCRWRLMCGSATPCWSPCATSQRSSPFTYPSLLPTPSGETCWAPNLSLPSPAPQKWLSPSSVPPQGGRWAFKLGSCHQSLQLPGKKLLSQSEKKKKKKSVSGGLPIKKDCQGYLQTPQRFISSMHSATYEGFESGT